MSSAGCEGGEVGSEGAVELAGEYSEHRLGLVRGGVIYSFARPHTGGLGDFLDGGFETTDTIEWAHSKAQPVLARLPVQVGGSDWANQTLAVESECGNEEVSRACALYPLRRAGRCHGDSLAGPASFVAGPAQASDRAPALGRGPVWYLGWWQ